MERARRGVCVVGGGGGGEEVVVVVIVLVIALSLGSGEQLQLLRWDLAASPPHRLTTSPAGLPSYRPTVLLSCRLVCGPGAGAG